MPVRNFVIAIAVAAIAGAASAEPAKAPARNASQPAGTQPPVVVASATPTATPALIAQAQSSAPAKRVRTARVGNCRCGGQTPTEN